MTRRFWTEAERDEVRRRYPHEKTDMIAADLCRPVSQVYSAAHSMGLKKTAAFLSSEASGRRQTGNTDTQFRPGTIPWNKGIPGSTGNHPNTQRTQFKAGRKPEDSRNYRPVGSLRICRDGILQRKVTDDPSLYPSRRWVAVHRLVWEAANGPIPKGHAVVFRPGMASTDPDAITIDTVELITRAELMRRNTRHNLPPELNALISTKARLTRLINEREKDHELQD